MAVMASSFPYLMTAASSAGPEMIVIIAAVCHLAGEASSSQNSFLKGVPESHLREVRYQWSQSWWVAEPGLETNLVSGQNLRAFSTAMPCTVPQECLHSPRGSRRNRLSCWEFMGVCYFSICFNMKIVALGDPD